MNNLTLPNRTNKAEQTMTTGAILKSTRLKKGVSLEEVAQKTYIKLHYLQALEDDRFDLLPAPVYTSGYIRQYAKLLGLEGNDLVQKYHKQNQGYQAAPSQSPSYSDVREVKITQENKLLADLTRRPSPLSPSPLPQSSIVQPPPSQPPQRQHILLPGESNSESQVTNDSPHDLDMVEGVRHEARLLRYNAEQYADQILRQLEEEIRKTLSIIKNGRAYLKTRLNNYR